MSASEPTPADGKLAIVLLGDLAAILAFAAHSKKPGAPLLEAGLAGGLLSQKRWVRGQDLNL